MNIMYISWKSMIQTQIFMKDNDMKSDGLASPQHTLRVRKESLTFEDRLFERPCV